MRHGGHYGCAKMLDFFKTLKKKLFDSNRQNHQDTTATSTPLPDPLMAILGLKLLPRGPLVAGSGSVGRGQRL